MRAPPLLLSRTIIKNLSDIVKCRCCFRYKTCVDPGNGRRLLGRRMREGGQRGQHADEAEAALRGTLRLFDADQRQTSVSPG